MPFLETVHELRGEVNDLKGQIIVPQQSGSRPHLAPPTGKNSDLKKKVHSLRQALEASSEEIKHLTQELEQNKGNGDHLSHAKLSHSFF